MHKYIRASVDFHHWRAQTHISNTFEVFDISHNTLSVFASTSHPNIFYCYPFITFDTNEVIRIYFTPTMCPLRNVRMSSSNVTELFIECSWGSDTENAVYPTGVAICLVCKHECPFYSICVLWSIWKNNKNFGSYKYLHETQ
jgi:hypothetical protein